MDDIFKKEVSGRLDAATSMMEEQDLDIILLTSPHNIYYLTLFQSTGYYLPHMVALGREHPPLFLLRDFEISALKRTGNTDFIAWGCLTPYAAAEAAFRERLGLGTRRLRIGYEGGSNFSSVNFFSSIWRDSGVELIDVGLQLDALRRQKSPSELGVIRSAGAAAAAGMKEGLRALSPAATELDLSFAMSVAMMKAGAECPASFPYVYFGERTQISMQQPSTNPFARGDRVYLECGARLSCYNAANIRTGGRATDQRFHEAYKHALEAFELMFNALKPGVRSRDIDAAARGYLRANGVEEYWLHRGGYSMGIGFAPGWGEGGVLDIRPDNETILPEGCVFHLVSLLSMPQLGFVGLSETVEVGSAGARSLTPHSRSAIVTDQLELSGEA